MVNKQIVELLQTTADSFINSDGANYNLKYNGYTCIIHDEIDYQFRKGTPKLIEANVLLECFQWSDTNYNIEEVKEELADVMNYCIQMSLVLNVDIIDIINAKMDKTELKYPVDKSKGVSTKYNKL